MDAKVVDGLSHIADAVEVLKRGGLVALPTETVYGLAADAENELAVRRIFATKGRPETHPLIVHVSGIDALDGWAREIPEAARKLAAEFWPGPLTMVLPRGPRALDVVTGGQDTVALRVPSHEVARALLKAFGGGLAAPSANRFGHVSPTTAEHVAGDLGTDVDLILDGGPSEVGVESTIVDLSSDRPAILRPGGVAREEISRVLGVDVQIQASSTVRTPGMLASHYAPRAGVFLADRSTVYRRAEALEHSGQRIAVIGPRQRLPGGVALLEAPEDAEGLARVLYAKLREADTEGFDLLVVQLPPEDGMGLAVQDRLKRAAAPRSTS